jgi:hypothetical protein
MRMMVTNCLKIAGLGNSVPRNLFNWRQGPRSTPALAGLMRFAILGVDGRDYAPRVTLPKPNMAWVMDDGSTAGPAFGPAP